MTIGRTWLGPQKKGHLETTDATADQVLLEVAIPFKHTAQVAVYVMATDGTDTLFEASLQGARRDGATATYDGEVSADSLISAGFAGAAVAYDCSGVNLRIKVTGIAATTIKWFAVAAFEDSSVNVPIIAEFATNDTTQSHTYRVTNTIPYWLDWGDGNFDALTGNGALQTTTHNYASAGWYHVRVMILAKANILLASVANNGMRNAAAPFSGCSGLTHVYLNDNRLAAMPDLSASTGLVQVSAYNNGTWTGALWDLTANSALVFLQFQGGFLTGYTASTIATTCTTFQVHNNLLPQSAIDQILADFETGVAGRPAAGTISLGGTGNAAPSAAGLASKAAILAAKPGWTITHN